MVVKALFAARAARFVALALAAMVLAAAPAAAQSGDEDADSGPIFPTTEFADGATSATVEDSGLSVRVFQEKRPKVDADLPVPVLEVKVGGLKVLEATGLASGLDFVAASASIAEIDPGNDTKEVYFTSYSGGAHCCSQVIVATQTPKGWTAVEVGTFDGDGDYLQDADNDGVAEIVTVDNAFLYTFDCYACSAAPLVIRAIRDGAVVDVTTEPRFLSAHRSWLRQLEEDEDPETRWTSAGFLAGWVAAKSRVGEGEDAMKQLLAHWNLKADEGEDVCLTGGDIDACPAKDKQRLKFPDRLKLFLDQNGYKV